MNTLDDPIVDMHRERILTRAPLGWADSTPPPGADFLYNSKTVADIDVNFPSIKFAYSTEITEKSVIEKMAF